MKKYSKRSEEISLKAVWSFNILDDLIFEVYNERPSFPFLQVEQVHSNIIVGPDEIPCKADGIIIKKNEFQNLGIKTADCLPIALFGESEVALIHAGWRGLQSNILLDEKLKKLSPHIAIIGPYINQKNYQIGVEVYREFSNQEVFKKDSEKDKWFLHLGYFAQTQLFKLNPSIIAIHCPLDTFESPNLHSFRRDQTTKRNYNILRKKTSTD